MSHTEPLAVAIKQDDTTIHTQAIDAFTIDGEKYTVVAPDEDRSEYSGEIIDVTGVCKLWVNQHGETEKLGTVCNPTKYPDGRMETLTDGGEPHVMYAEIQRVKAL